MPSSLPRSAPADQRVDPAAILSFLDAVEARPDVEMHSLMVVRHGRVVAEGWWAPYSAERPQLLYSLSKSFTATAAAFAQDEGLLEAPAPALPRLTIADGGGGSAARHPCSMDVKGNDLRRCGVPASGATAVTAPVIG
jgi:CubicO group peptidase (beta-lactamase class C family)